MKKIVLSLLTVLMSVMAFAQLSPLTEVEFYKAYLDVPIVKTASLANGKISNEMLDYIFKKSNPKDIKYAIINALGAKGKATKAKNANKTAFNNYVSENYDNFNDETMKLFSVGTQLSIVYFFAVINYLDCDDGILEGAQNFGVSCSRSDIIVSALICTQNDMNEYLRELKEIEESEERVPVLLAQELEEKVEKAEIKAAKYVKSMALHAYCDEEDKVEEDMRKNAVNIVWNYFKEYDKAIATISIVSKSKNPYQISINGEVIGNTEPYENYEYQCAPGYYHIKAVQVSGYAFSPTVNNRDVNVSDGDNVTVTIGYED
jgi:hypothetical protein